MKRLLWTTALTGALLATTPAKAGDVELGLDGFINAGVVFGNFTDGGDRAEDPFTIIRDGEIQFKGKGTLDNGITIEARVELEVFTSSDQIDENWLLIKTQFGDVKIGADDDAGDAVGNVGYHRVTPTQSYYDASLSFTPGGDQNTLVGEDDDIGIQYFTPRLFGLKVGVGYQPDLSSDGGSDGQATGADNDAQRLTAGVNYQTNVSDVDIEVGGNIANDFGADDADIGGESDFAWGAGAEIGYAGVTLLGRYEESFDNDEDDEEGSAYMIGVDYRTGPWRIGGGYAEQNFQDGVETRVAIGGVRYKLGDGVGVSGSIQYGENKGAGLPEDEEDGVSGTVTMNVNF